MTHPTLLVVSPDHEDHAFVRRIVDEWEWPVLSAYGCDEALDMAQRHEVAVVIAERHLGNDCWKSMWNVLSRAARPPMLIVTSQDADNRLWAEVLNLGGWDVLAKPLNGLEVERSVTGASRRRQERLAVEQVRG